MTALLYITDASTSPFIERELLDSINLLFFSLNSKESASMPRWGLLITIEDNLKSLN
jgi:hypothetical protein